jgi:alpha-D-ribose 1-methylphosphonate 5-triphosphate diphosphatase
MQIRNARVLMPEGIVTDAAVTIDEDRIGAVGGASARRILDARGLLLLPGVIDLHGDAFERQLMPRPGVQFPTDLALIDTDRQMVANGITTALHGLTWSWEPGLRGRDAALAFADALDRLRPTLACDTHLHLRHETFNTEAADEIAAWLAAGRVRLLAFNNHLPAIGKLVDQPTRLAKYAERAQMTIDDFAALVRRVTTRAERVDPTNRRLAELARQHGVAMASHDDETPAMRRHFHELGCDICEFPMNPATAEEGRRLGGGIILGAPNVLRGRSHQVGGMRAADMAAAGLLDVLTSDYYYPAPVQAAFRLARDGVLDFAGAWALISTRAARLGGFTDRGSIAAGQRADLVLIDDRDAALPRVVATIVAGRLVFAARAFA